MRDIGVNAPRVDHARHAVEPFGFDAHARNAELVESKTVRLEFDFERFDDYYYQPANGFPEDRRVNFQSLDMYLVPEESTRVAAIRSGEADIAPASVATRSVLL